jgi:hypothetical protein
MAGHNERAISRRPRARSCRAWCARPNRSPWTTRGDSRVGAGRCPRRPEARRDIDATTEKTPPPGELRDRIEARVGYRCEHFRAPQPVCGYRFHLDQIRPIARRGSESLSNRCLACASCEW